MSILIGADIVPGTKNNDFFKNGDIEALIGSDLASLLDSVDYRVFNLETPLTDFETPIDKCGQTFRSNSSTVIGIKKMGIDLLTLANNHIMDQGEKGLSSTIELLNNKKIKYIGAGNNLSQASLPVIVKIKDKKIGFYACTEHEFSIATENKAGANPFDALESFDHIESLKSKCDYVIVLYHGGKEHYRYPSPILQRVCHKFVDKGADFVFCQHSHCIGCEEKYQSGTIVYGQGNFLFDGCKGPFAQNSLLIKLKDDFSIDYIPLIKIEKGVRLAKEEEALNILEEYKNRSEQICNKDFVKYEYTKFAKEQLNWYLLNSSGHFHKTILRLLNKITLHHLSILFNCGYYNKKDILAIQNFLDCEAHRELWLEGLKNR